MNGRMASLLIVMLVCLTSVAFAQEAAQKLLEQADQEWEGVKKIIDSGDWKDIDLETVDKREAVGALILMNDLMGYYRQRNERRLGALTEYLKKEGLSEAYLKYEDYPAMKDMDFEDAKKIAVAAVRTPEGKTAYEGRVSADASDEVLTGMIEFYLRTCGAEFGKLRLDNYNVARMLAFIDSQGKLNDFLAWADEQMKAAEAKKQQELAEAREKKAEQDQAAAEKRMELAAERQKQQHEYAMKRMDYAYQLRSDQVKASAQVQEARYNSRNQGWGGYGGYYYKDGRRYYTNW